MRQFSVERPVYTRPEFDSRFLETKDEEKKTIRQRFAHKAEKVKSSVAKKCTKQHAWNSLQSLFPVLKWMRHYKWKNDLPSDIITGLTVAIMMVPQSMGYAQIAHLPPICGLYSSFFSLLVYFLMGTSRHVSVAPAAVISWMTGTAVHKWSRIFIQDPNVVSHIQTELPGNVSDYLHIESDLLIPQDYRILVTMGVALVAGFFQLAFGICKLGCITLYLSESLTDGFVTGAALYIMTSQFKYIFGLKIPHFTGVLKLLRTWYAIAEGICTGYTKVPELIIAATGIVILLVVKMFINKRFKLRIPIPIDFILVVIITALSWRLNFEERWDVKIVKDVPVGINKPELPPFFVVKDLIMDGFIISVTAFAFTVSVASHLAKKHHYEIDSNQEFLALGVDSIVCSVFQGITPAASFSRSLLQESLGGKTQLASAICSMFILSVLLYFGQYLETLPKAILAAVIIVALRETFSNYKCLPRLWRESKVDFAVWVVTYLSVVILEVHYGLIVGIVFSLLTVIVRTQFARGVVFGGIPDTDIYQDIAHFKEAHEIPGIKIFRYESDINYINASFFHKKLIRLTGIDPVAVKEHHEKAVKRAKKLLKEEEKEKSSQANAEHRKSQPDVAVISVPHANTNVAFEMEEETAGVNNNPESIVDRRISMASMASIPPTTVSALIIDCSLLSLIDLAGKDMLLAIYNEYRDVGIDVYFANCHFSLIRTLNRMGFFDKVLKDHVFMSIHDAVIHCTESTLYSVVISEML